MAGAHDRHPKKRLVDFLTGLRPVGKGGVAPRIGQVERAHFVGDKADKALADLEFGFVHRPRIEAFGGVEFERIVAPQQIDRADLRHHIGGDEHDDLVQPLLGRFGLRHDLAEPS